jgi:hypothetical protein
MIKNNPSILIVTIALMVLIGCGWLRPGVTERFRDPNFSLNDLVAGKLVLGPVTSVTANEDEQESDDSIWTHLLWISLDSETSDINLMPSEFLSQTLGDDYIKLKRAVEDNGQLDDHDFDRLQEDLVDSGTFILIVRFDDDKTTLEESETLDSTGTVTDVTLKTKRELQAHVAVYDITTTTLVWSADIRQSKSASKTFNADSDRGGGWFGNTL